jgi:hypothetical protein
MQVVMEDRILSEKYMLPITRDWDPDPVPNPNALANRPDVVVTPMGRGVFRKLPPGVEPMPVNGVIARFEAGGSSRLLTQVEVEGSPGDSMWAEWVVLDSTMREVKRAARALGPSDCDPTELRVADFAADLPAGSYQIGLSVRDGHGRRGLYKDYADLGGAGRALTLSDIVVSCGSPSLMVYTAESPVVRIAPNPAGRVSRNEPLTAYFEIYHLAAGRDGQSRFEYVYVVKSAEKDPRIWIQRLLNPLKTPNPIEVSREEQNAGDMRRQFVSVPVHALPPGRYKLEIRVRDLVAQSEAVSSTQFVKL